ncbi:hypothetical protein [Nocardia fusca]|uniref:hypothetical protein n=1 Tax=Nocardia fusca TaxID=941183 RepID=UPI0007A740AC|nr:hypothetical protein [Nocardia fusca]
MNGEHINTAQAWREFVAAPETPGVSVFVDDWVWSNIEVTIEVNGARDWPAASRTAIAVTGADSDALVREFAARMHRAALDTSAEVEHPVAWVDLAPAPTIAELDRAICGFFGQQTRRGEIHAGVDCLSAHRTSLLVLAGLDGGARGWRSPHGETTKARIIELTGRFTGTVILCGDRLDGLFAGEDPITSQLASRTIVLTTDPEQPPAQEL